MYHIADGKAPPLGALAPSPQAKAFLECCCQPVPKQRSLPAQLLAHPFITGTPTERPDAAPPANLAPPPAADDAAGGTKKAAKASKRRASATKEPTSPTSKAIDLARSKM